MKKILGIALAGVLSFGLMKDVYATTFNVNDWDNMDDSKISAVSPDEKVYNFKGSSSNIGPYTKASKQTVPTGVDESVYVELDPEKFVDGEHFKLDIGLNVKGTEDHLTDLIMVTEKVGDKLVIRFGEPWMPDFKIEIAEKGVYTYNYKMFIKEDKAYVNFTVSRGNEVIKSTGDVDFDTINPADRAPMVEKVGAIRYIWFNYIDVAEGVNVYSELPVAPATPETPDTPDTTPEKNPNTSDNAGMYFIMALAGLGLAGYTTKKLIKN